MDRRSKAGSRIYGRIGSNGICCPKNEDVHRSSWPRTFVPSLSLWGSSSSTNTVGKITSFSETPACLCNDSSPYPEKKLWLIAVLLNFSPNLSSVWWNPCPQSHLKNRQDSWQNITQMFPYNSVKNSSPAALQVVWQNEDLTSQRIPEKLIVYTF